MEKVETKHFIKNQEITLIAERFGTKIYQDGDTFYIVNLDDLVATFNVPPYTDEDMASIIIEDECRSIF